jgi:hypothetical protein
MDRLFFSVCTRQELRAWDCRPVLRLTVKPSQIFHTFRPSPSSRLLPEFSGFLCHPETVDQGVRFRRENDHNITVPPSLSRRTLAASAVHRRCLLPRHRTNHSKVNSETRLKSQKREAYGSRLAWHKMNPILR